MKNQKDDFAAGMSDGLLDRPYAGNLPGVDNRSYGDGYDKGFIVRRDREAAAAVAIPETMGDRLKALRKDRGMSLEKLARASGTVKGYIWELENGVSRRPSAEKLGALAMALGVTIDHLVNGDEGLPLVERMRQACLDALWDEARGWQSARTYSSLAEMMANSIEKEIKAIDVRKLAG